MYIIDFFRSIAKKSKIPICIYLLLNTFIIAVVITIMINGTYWKGYILGILLYAVSLMVAISPVGEFILRVQTGCTRISHEEEIDFIEPIFKEVYDKARKEDKSIPNNVKVYINSDETPNAFATGRRTICLTKGMLYMPENQIKAVLSHEFGHLAHKDTDLILMLSVGNLIVPAFILFLRLLIELIHIGFSLISICFGGSEGSLIGLVDCIYNVVLTAVVSGFTWIWTKLGILLVMKTSRGNEFEADEFAFKLGYGNDLCILIDNIDDSGAKGLFANLASSHPSKCKRIERLQKMGATYRAMYGAE